MRTVIALVDRQSLTSVNQTLCDNGGSKFTKPVSLRYQTNKSRQAASRSGIDFSMDPVNAIQWPAMLVTVVAAWMVASQRKFKRNWGFWLFLLSNVLWIVWGLHDRAFALILLQLCLAFLNIRGAMKNRPQETKT